MSHNSQLKALLKDSQTAAMRAESETDLLDVLQDLKDFGSPIKYDNLILHLLAATAAITAAVWWWVIYQSGQGFTRLESAGFIVLCGGAVASIAFAL